MVPTCELRRIENHISGLDSDANLEAHFQRFQGGVDVRHRSLQLHGRPSGAQRIVLMRGRNAKHRDHRVAEILLDLTPMASNNFANRVEEPFQDDPQTLRIEALAQYGRVDEIAEHDRDNSALAKCDFNVER